jgi:hypothetical protein
MPLPVQILLLNRPGSVLAEYMLLGHLELLSTLQASREVIQMWEVGSLRT